MKDFRCTLIVKTTRWQQKHKSKQLMEMKFKVQFQIHMWAEGSVGNKNEIKKKICLLSTSSGFQWSITDLNIWYRITTASENENKQNSFKFVIFLQIRRERFSLFRGHKGLVLNTWKNVRDWKPSATFHSINRKFWMKNKMNPNNRRENTIIRYGMRSVLTDEKLDWKFSLFIWSLKNWWICVFVKTLKIAFGIKSIENWDSHSFMAEVNSPIPYNMAMYYVLK